MIAATESGSTTGTTTASYVEVFRLDTRGCGVQGKMLISIKNTSGTVTMKYKIDGYPGMYGGLSIACKSETSIGTSTQVDSTDVDKGYAAVVLSVIDNSGHATYQVDWTTY